VLRLIASPDRAAGIAAARPACYSATDLVIPPRRQESRTHSTPIRVILVLLGGQRRGNRSGSVGAISFDAVAMTFGMFVKRPKNYMGVSCRPANAPLVDGSAGDAFGSYQWRRSSSMKPNDMFGVGMSQIDPFRELHDFMRKGGQHL
jgi:hypothetical protein